MIRWWVEHPVATWMLFAALIVCGAYAVPRLDLEAMPETDLPKLTIVTSWPGASPSAVQRSLTLPIEEAAAKCHGVEDIESTSRHGRSTVEVSFRREQNLDFARLELSEHLGAVRRSLPPRASQPVIVPEMPEEVQVEEFFSVSLISPLAPNKLREEAEDWAVPRFLAVPGVADAELRGGALPLLRVLLDLEAMERYGLTADGIAGRLSALDAVLPVGTVRRSSQELTLTVHDSVTVAGLARAVIANRGGQTITLDRVARVERSFEDVVYFRRINGDNVISLRITERSGENAVALSRRLREALPAIAAAMPFPVQFDVESDKGADLEKKLKELVVRSLVIMGLLFALLAIVLKRPDVVAIVIGSILFAIVICLSLFYFFGLSVNFITISGLTICFGMLLDNSILVLDSVHRRLSERSRGSAKDMLILGTREVSFPILATTLTNIVAFLSFIYLTGRLALFYVPLGISVSLAMSASMFTAFCWLPVALRGTAERMQRRQALHPAGPPRQGWPLLWRWSLITLVAGGLSALGIAFAPGAVSLRELAPWLGGAAGLLLLIGLFVAYVERITRLNLRLWFVNLIVFAGLCYGAVWAYQEKISKGGFWRPAGEETLRLYLERPVGTDVLLTSETMRLFEQELLPLPADVRMRVDCFENWAYMQMEFETDATRISALPELYRNKLIVLAEELGGMFIFVGGFGDPYLKGGRGGAMSNSTILLTGYNSKDLKELSDGISARLSRNRRVRNVMLSSGSQFERAGTEETLVVIRREALARYRLSVAEVTAHLRRLIGVDIPWHMVIEGEDEQIQLSFADAENIQYDAVLGKTMTTSRGEKVRLSELLRLETRPELSAITRKDQRYSQRVNWEFVGTDRMRQSFLKDILAGLELPYGFTAEDVSGQQISEEEKEQLTLTLLLTLLFIFMTLAAMMENLLLPLLVMVSVPMGLIGVVAIFWASDATFDSSAQIGLILLFGVVVNNAILLVNRFRLSLRELVEAQGLTAGPAARVPDKPRLGGWDLWRLPGAEARPLLHRAIVDGTRIQMRSILLATGTTVFGMLPLLYQIEQATGDTKDIWENLALASIGGLTSSAVLILSAIPAMYWIFTRWGWGLARLGRRLGARRRGSAVAPQFSPQQTTNP
ncbi:efflux RND transporter permease subunit [bacterium]|nr:efflux RND transporter permease subunit [bacterium]